MKKIDNSKLTIYKLVVLLVLTLSIVHCPLSISPALAADSTPSSDLQSKLQALQTEIASKAAQMKQQISQKLQNKAYVGFLKAKSDSSLTVATENGTEIVNINQFTAFSDQTTGTRSVTLKNLTTNDYLAALGDIDDNGVLTAKKIVALDAPKPTGRMTVFGQVTSVDPSGETVTVQTPDNHSQSFNWNSDTVFKLGVDNGQAADVKVGKNIIVVGIAQQSGSQLARLIVVMGDNSSAKPASSSATPKSSN